MDPQNGEQELVGEQQDPSARSVDEFSPSQSTPTKSRAAPHALLSAVFGPSGSSRKIRSSEGEVTSRATGRASLSLAHASASRAATSRSISFSGSSASVMSSGDERLNIADKTAGKYLDGSAVSDEPEKLSNTESLPSVAASGLSALSRPLRYSQESEGNRLSFSSLLSIGSAIYSGGTASNAAESATSSVAGSLKSPPFPEQASVSAGPLSPSLGSSGTEASSAPTVATCPVSVTSQSGVSQAGATDPPKQTTAGLNKTSSESLATLGTNTPDHRSRSRTQRRPSGSTVASSASPHSGSRGAQAKLASLGTIGICALDTKARSKPSRNILTRLQNNGEFEIVVFGDKVILDEAVENWPLCDFLISFFSDGFPLDKAISYAQLRKPFCVNDLPMQKVLWDRRLCLRILDNLGVPTPGRLEVNRDGGPRLESASLADHMYRMNGVRLEGPDTGVGGGLPGPKTVELADDGDTLIVDGITLKKPFVEKPVSGEDHNVHIYFPKSHHGGGGRKLFRKIGNKSSEWDKDLTVPRAITEEGSSYLYEQFLHVDNAEDVKAYTVGSDFCHAETRKSPVVDGLVRRNTHGKEIRYITSLSKEEATMASRIAEGFGQRICGFDLLRAGNQSFVIDVNGWSFVKDNNEYYDKCASLLRQMFIAEKERHDTQQGMTAESGNETDVASSKHFPASHRQVLKGIFKSPSLSKLRGTYHKPHGNALPEPFAVTTPIDSSPNFEQPQYSVSATVKIAQEHPAFPLTPSVGPAATPTSIDQLSPATVPMPAAKHSWKLKGMVSVIRHADRTPKQKFKFTFHTQPFIDLLKGHQEEVLLKGEAALGSVLNAVKQAMEEGVEDPEKLNLLRTSLARKGAWTGTKVQIKPMFRKRKPEEIVGGKPSNKDTNDLDNEKDLERSTTARSDSLTGGVTFSRYSAAEKGLVLDKLQLVIKWGGEPTHAARYQSQDLGENMRKDLLLMNKEALGDVRVFTSSERRVVTSAQIWASSFLDQQDVPKDFISVRKDLLDDSNAAKDVMDKVKKRLKLLLRAGHEAPPQFAWPQNTPEPSIVVKRVSQLMRLHRRVMRHNFTKLANTASASLSALNQAGEVSMPPPPDNDHALARATASIQARWCCGEDAELFKERWEKLFSEFSDSEKVDPSKISELYDTMKFDALHNRQFLEWVFTPSSSLLEEIEAEAERASYDKGSLSDKADLKNNNPANGSSEKPQTSRFAERMRFKRKSTLSTVELAEENPESYFKLFGGSGEGRAKQDVRLENLRELYRLAKILNDFICPQEYGIENSEKLEIGLLTSLPLLEEIVQDLEEVQASEDAKSFVYFTKESHIYTLLNAILEGGVKTKIARNAIPELDYLSQIVFELYESEDKEAEAFAYSIRIGITPGCHTSDPLDLQLDSKHSIGCAPRRSLTAHEDWKEVIETLRAKFHTVKLPKSFLAINLSDRQDRDLERKDGKTEPGDSEESMDGGEEAAAEQSVVPDDDVYAEQDGDKSMG